MFTTSVSSIWSLVLTTSSVQMGLFYNKSKQADLKDTLREIEPFYGLPGILEYDYIIVGGGTAGCLIAGKLSETGFTVLLLEKGGDPPPPIMTQYLYKIRSSPEVNDFYPFIKQNYAYGKTNGIGVLKQGIMLGGSSAHNDMLYNRGSPEVYDEWAELVGDPSFSYRGMLEHYKEMENMQGFLFNENERLDFYGVDGPFSVETDLPTDFGNWFEAGSFLGFRAGDPNAHLEQSFTTSQLSTRNSTRETSCTAFVFRRPNDNLKINRFSNALKILTEEGTAVGVVYVRHGIAQVAMATKEVILSAGPLGSPILLLRSGIGPRHVLEQSGIPVILDLPGVGAYLQDHTSIDMSFKQQAAMLNDKQIISFLTLFPGGRGATGAFGLQAHIRTSVAPWAGAWPDIQIVLEQDPLEPSNVQIFVILVRPKSSGSLWINTTALSLNEQDSTKVVRPDPNYFHIQEDLDAFVEGLEFVFQKLLQTPQLKAQNLTFVGNFREGCEAHEESSKGFWTCFVKQKAQTVYHLVGTAKMGRYGDDMRVVDSNFRVVGLKGLRVADSSVMPKISNSNTQAPSLALASKAVHAVMAD